MTPRILIIAGSDSGGGAGIQADIKTVTMLGGHAMTAITAITAQNTLGVQAVMPVPAEMVIAQIKSVVSDIGVDAVKIGMIGSAETANAVADVLTGMHVPIVFDPVMVATSGGVLADDETIAAFGRLMALATLVTPNLPELAALSRSVATATSVRAERAEALPSSSTPAARTDSPSTGSGQTEESDLSRRIGSAILVKGGHGDGETVIDRLFDFNGEIARWENTRINTRNSHGTGCTLASGIATGLAQGMPLTDAIGRAIDFVRAALATAPGLGAGHGPMGHALGLAPFDALKDRR